MACRVVVLVRLGDASALSVVGGICICKSPGCG